MKAARLLLGSLAALCACSFPADDAAVSISSPERESFPMVAQVLVRHCGTLDCHGQSSRNLRLYGHEGLRWSVMDLPQTPVCTTVDEYDQDYASVVGLEPELLNRVIAEGGSRPERLTLLRKARGTESHEGGAPLPAGGPGDRCFTSWLRAQTDRESCLAALPISGAACFED